MNKRYIDFVPSQNKTAARKQSVAPKPKVSRPVTPKAVAPKVAPRVAAPRQAASRPVAPRTVASRPVAPQVVPRQVAPRVAMSSRVTPRANTSQAVAPRAAMSRTSLRETSALGEIEDLNQRRSVSKAADEELLRAKATKVRATANLKATAGAASTKPVEKPVEKLAKSEEKSTFKTPKTPFINQEKVVKRPLSKNVYQKQANKVAKTVEPKGTVIIAKPEKDAHVSIVVTIIITIILGAAAGTVAFLLLPK